MRALLLEPLSRHVLPQPVVVTDSETEQVTLTRIASDARDRELEIVAVEKPDCYLAIHVMPTSLRRKGRFAMTDRSALGPIGPDIDLDSEEVYLPDGSRLTEAAAEQLAERVLEQRRAGRPSVTGGSQRTPCLTVRVPRRTRQALERIARSEGRAGRGRRSTRLTHTDRSATRRGLTAAAGVTAVATASPPVESRFCSTGR
jgi:hypothetical protein